MERSSSARNIPVSNNNYNSRGNPGMLSGSPSSEPTIYGKMIRSASAGAIGANKPFAVEQPSRSMALQLWIEF
eukprot:TRINITY_DN19886_c0_g1_i1.p1 TRINITY_DN19886_c0_g1~~TRINITY_DN19886_c0_g1_i1.p1  ORF type:complete len:73 (-),score=9.85 TRINITY_DN19886_c0_g1_i1:234-452(-)